MELRDYLRGLRRHWLAVTLMVLLGIGAGYGWTLLQTPVYQASASGFVKSRESAEAGTSISGDQVARSKVLSYLDVAGWRIVADEAISDLGLDEAPELVASRVTVANVQNTVILKVTANGATPTEARDLAEAWVSALAVAIDELEGDGRTGSSPVTVVLGGAASVPTSPVFPDVVTAVIAGGLLGLGFGIAFALVRTASDRRVRTADDVEAKTGVAVVGSIPVTAGLDGEHRIVDVTESNFAVSEALRTMRTNLQFMDVDDPPRTIVVTSPLPGDGKSTIASNLALTLAASGQPVVLVDGDLRRPTVAKTMGLPGGAGLTDVLAGRATLTEVLQRTTHSSNLLVLAAGSVPPNPSEVLGSARMKTLLTDLAKHATVIIDAPPLLPVTDGAVLTHQADGALLVVSLGKTTYDVIERAIGALTKVRGRVLGVVLNRVPLRGIDAASYSHEYRQAYGGLGTAEAS